MRFRRFAAAVMCAAAVISVMAATGCEKDKNSSSDSTADVKKPSVNTALSPVELKDYAFPDFLQDIAVPDMLSKEVYSSFDQQSMVKKVTEQPFDGYSCTDVYEDEYYVFTDGGYVGILNKNGTELLAADKYSSAELVSQGLVKLDYVKDSNQPSEYLRLENGRAELIEDYSFSKKNIKFAEDANAAEDSDKKHYTLTVGGKSVYDVEWDTAREVTQNELQTAKGYSAAYKTSTANGSFFIIFDKYYNFRVYEGVYGMVKLKIGNVYGECYILSADDYSELNKMITSFGNETNVKAPSKDETLDFIQIIFGMGTADQVEVTISSDGYCLTDSITHNEQPVNKYFSVLSKETFVDLVNWVGDTLSAEYE